MSQKKKSSVERAPGEARYILAVDVGNTNVVVGIFHGEKLLKKWRFVTQARTGDEIGLVLEQLVAGVLKRRGKLSRAVVCSVVPDLTGPYAEACEAVAGRETLVVGPEVETGLEMQYLEPSSVGSDRIVNAVAAHHFYETPAVVVDLGTATTFDLVEKGARYVGGAIAPGIATSAAELFAKAARLEPIRFSPPDRVVGRTTTESLLSGIVFGAADMIDGMIARISRERGITPTVIGTGGLVSLIAPLSGSIQIVDEALSLKGLRLLGEMNPR